MQENVFENWDYVKKRHNKFYIRVPVPTEIRHIVEKDEITRTLGTGDPVEGRKAYGLKLAEIEGIFEKARQQLTPPDPIPISIKMAEGFATSYFHEQFYQSENTAHKIVADGGVEMDDGEYFDRKEYQMQIDLDCNDARSKGESYARYLADHILLENGFETITVKNKAPSHNFKSTNTRTIPNIDRECGGYKHLLRLSYLGQVEIFERMLAILNGGAFDKSNSNFERMLTIQRSPSSSLVLQNQLATPHQGRAPISLEELLEQYIEANPAKRGQNEEDTKRKTNNHSREINDIRAAFRAVFELCGKETDANTLSKKHFRDLLVFYRRMPSHIGNSKGKWANMSLSQIVEETEKQEAFEEDLLAPRTVNKYIRRVAKVFSWAEDEPLISKNYAKGISIPEDEIDDEDKRLPFDRDALNKIFCSEPFIQAKRTEPSLYWASLLSLFNGMRSEEILQLRSFDFQTEDGTWLVDIHKRDGNSLKNKSSARKVPLHPIMKTMGLHTLVRAAEKCDEATKEKRQRATSYVLRALLRYRAEDWHVILAYLFHRTSHEGLKHYIVNWVAGHFLPYEKFQKSVEEMFVPIVLEGRV